MINIDKDLKPGNPLDTGRKFNLHKTLRRNSGRLLNVLCTFKLRPVSMGKLEIINNLIPKLNTLQYYVADNTSNSDTVFSKFPEAVHQNLFFSRIEFTKKT